MVTAISRILQARGGGDYEVVFLDIGLPMVDGMSVLARVRQSADAAARPVEILSAYNEPPLLARGEELGVRRYLGKSDISPSQCAAGLRGWVDN